VTALIEVSPLTTILVAGNVPKTTFEVPVKPVPDITTGVPPTIGPAVGVIEVGDGAPTEL
jgi:hypothetical protein